MGNLLIASKCKTPLGEICCNLRLFLGEIPTSLSIDQPASQCFLFFLLLVVSYLVSSSARSGSTRAALKKCVNRIPPYPYRKTILIAVGQILAVKSALQNVLPEVSKRLQSQTNVATSGNQARPFNGRVKNGDRKRNPNQPEVSDSRNRKENQGAKI